MRDKEGGREREKSKKEREIKRLGKVETERERY
jgi:hypothetical protein